MRVLVTGGTGFIGSHTVAALVGRGHDVRVLARTPSRVDQVLAPLGVAGVEVAPGDMTDAAAVANPISGCQAVAHTAAEIGVAGGTGPGGTTNVQGVRTVIGLAVEAGLDPDLHVDRRGLPADRRPGGDPGHAARRPLSAYGRGDAEALVREWQADGAPVTTFVIGGVYGPQSPHLDGSFAALKGALETFMAVAPGGMGVADVRDLSELLAAAVEPGRGPRRSLAGGNYLTWAEWTAALSQAVGREVTAQDMTAEEMVDLGRQLDQMRAAGDPVDVPLSEEAAVIMVAGKPTEDGPTLADLGGPWRPTVETFRDTVAWLVAEGHLAPEPGLAG